MRDEQVIVRQEADGAKRVILTVGGEEVSWCWIVPKTIRVGAALIRMDGIGGVETRPEHRLKGYSRRVLSRAVEEMRLGDASLSMLYGISNFYHRFGYVTAGPEYAVFAGSLPKEAPLPKGWSVREFAPRDLPAVRRVYEQCTALATGAAIRAEECHVWQKLLETPGAYPRDECWVVLSPSGEVLGYAWRARWCWSVREILEDEFPDALVFGEALALTPTAADALLAFCRRRAAVEGKDEVMLTVPPDSMVGRAARYIDCRVVQMYTASGGSMVRVLSVERLLRALEPELSRQVRQCAQKVFPCQITFRTDLGEGTLIVTDDGVRSVQFGARGQLELHTTGDRIDAAYTVDLTQGTLARLALGFAPADDLCARLSDPPAKEVVSLLKLLFPVRYQHAYLPDRY